MRYLKDRGLSGAQLFISDACRGLVEAASEFFPQARWQRCAVHLYRNVFSHTPNNKMGEVARVLKAVHAQETREAAVVKATEIVEKMNETKLHKAAFLVQEKIAETLTYYAFPWIHWRQLKTNNMMERIMREIRRRTRVVGNFPDGQSALMLVSARLRHIAATQWGRRRYMNMDLCC